MKNHNKYKNKRCECDGYKFASIKEMNRYKELKLLEKSGDINLLFIHPKFKLYAGINYIADFKYTINGLDIVEDVKGYIMQEYKIKQKLFKEIYGFDITLV